MKLTTSKRGDVMVVTPHSQKIDVNAAVDFKAQLLNLIEEGNNRIVLNLGEVDFIDSSGLGALVAVVKKTGDEGGIRLFGVKNGVRSILELTRLDKVFGIHISEDGAVEGFDQ